MHHDLREEKISASWKEEGRACLPSESASAESESESFFNLGKFSSHCHPHPPSHHTGSRRSSPRLSSLSLT